MSTRPFIYGSSLTRDAPMTRRKKAMNRSRPPRREEKPKIVGTLKRGGTRKAKANARANRILKANAERQDITTCEVGGKNCTVSIFLSWAHGRKRRHLKEGELESFAILACFNCHWEIEKGGELQMTPQVEKILSERNTQ